MPDIQLSHLQIEFFPLIGFQKTALRQKHLLILNWDWTQAISHVLPMDAALAVPCFKTTHSDMSCQISKIVLQW